ncbi:hypothetical protein SporoP37_16715 (plasmid) [Sporosarcina sp. P37]|uniref:hypothetical protein n=1 Tax=Sporosarcina sp. P37 TaxID=1930546 RepID=UPI000A17E3B1|nr:hypothetical protein [Sporosarcina sp. P37]PID15765.1 hypothetical protein CSV62_16150 [Sporosarcina sp. P35]ARK23668.1 hypothetical protein SporoP37_02480 [Sporosarcina sp. P37]ARK24106.1 hypothetical protein SporoP37_05020 [Sporosarcina sp. P37]ARK25519.1 hypothetical protein SporoP37_13205 [Sporosarcina sp. P37]ARK26415.1 hypothetical protein SporoP37_16715 [Sporosarcina sp. P37]
MKRGILLFHQESEEWNIWVGHTCYWVFPGCHLDLKIDQQYLPAVLMKDAEWIIALLGVEFHLREEQIYKVRVQACDYVSVTEAPF